MQFVAMMKTRTFTNLLHLLLSLALGLLTSRSARAQSGGWSAPVNLSQSETNSGSPSVAVDPSGGVHVVWSEETEDGRAFISYSSQQDGDWSAANEIVASPYYEIADYPSLAADSQGTLHLVWRGDATLYYSRAYAPLAGLAQSWSRPLALEEVQDYIGAPDLVVDSQDRLYLIYPIILGARSGIYSLQSSDGGRTWSDPTVVYRNSRSNRMVDDAHLAVDANGGKHAAWVESNYPETFPPIGIRYAHALADEPGWSEALSLADGPYGDPAILARGAAEVHVVYSGTAEDRYKFHRWSADGGMNWSETYRNSEVGGYQGLPDLVLDGNYNLHWLTTAGVFQIGDDCLYHTIWQENSWTRGDVPLCGEVSMQNPWDVAAAVAFGNELHVIIQYPIASDVQQAGYQYEIFALHLELASKRLASRPLAAPTIAPATPATPDREAMIPTPQPTLIARAWQGGAPSDGLVLALGGGMLLALVLVIGVILLARRRER